MSKKSTIARINNGSCLVEILRRRNDKCGKKQAILYLHNELS